MVETRPQSHGLVCVYGIQFLQNREVGIFFYKIAFVIWKKISDVCKLKCAKKN